MTAVLDGPETDAPAPPAPAAPRRGARWARWRVDLRLARRQVLRAKGSSALVMLLVALPVAGMAGAAVFWQSHVPTAEQSATLELGRTESWIAVVGGPDPSRWQDVTQPWNNDVDRVDGMAPVNPELPAPTGPPALVPTSATTIEVREYGSLFVDTKGGTGRIPVTVGPVWDAVFEGRYVLLSGGAPTAAGDAMVSPGLLQRLGAAVGDDVVLADSGRSFRITGTMRQLDQRPRDDMLFLPSTAADLVPDSAPRWFSTDWQPSLDELGGLNRAGYIAFAHDLAVGPPAGSPQSSQSAALVWQMIAIGSIVAVFCGYLVVLLAGAAFAVAARRQQRALAVAASVGAARSDVRRIVVLQGTVLGLLGGFVGAVAGTAIAGILLAVTDDGVRGSFWGNWGLQVPWGIVAAILVFAVVIGTLSALAPARSATRGDVLGALRGSRRPARLAAKRPLWGLGMMILGIAATIAGALAITAMNAQEEVDYSNPLRVFALYGIVFGPVVFQIGILLAGHWTLVAISRGLSRLGLAPRLAGRDAAANPSRVVPAFAAIAACVFIASFALSMMALTGSASERTYSWASPKDTVAVTMWGQSAEEDSAAIRAAEDLLAPTQPVATGLVARPADAPYDPQTGQPTDDDAPVWSVATRYDAPGDCTTCDPRSSLANGNLSIVAPDDLATVLGQPIPAADLAAFRDGAALAVATWGRDFVQDDGIEITQWTSRGLTDYQNALNEYYQGSMDADSLPAPARVHEVPGRTLSLIRPQGMMDVVISPDTARSLGMQATPSALYAVYPEPPDDELVDGLNAAAANVRVGESGSLNVMVDHGPVSMAPWLWLICGVAVVLVIGAGAVCLGLARFERRPDDATLTAVGAGRGLRRGVNAWQAVIIVGVGTVVGTVAGLIPVWGVSQSSQDYLRFTDAPWLWLGILALGLPLVMTVAAWLVPPRHPDLTRRTAIA